LLFELEIIEEELEFLVAVGSSLIISFPDSLGISDFLSGVECKLLLFLNSF
jgi:hypothetical protein